MLLQCCNCVLHCWMTAYLLMCNRVSHLARCTLSLTGAARGHRPPLRSEVRGQRSEVSSRELTIFRYTRHQLSTQPAATRAGAGWGSLLHHKTPAVYAHAQRVRYACLLNLVYVESPTPTTNTLAYLPNTADIHTRRERSSAVTVCAATCLNQQPSLTPTVVPLQCNHLSKHTG